MSAATDLIDEAALAAGLILDRPGEGADPVTEGTKRRLSEILGPAPKVAEGEGGAAFVPPILAERRVFGVVLQLYQLRSARNLGVGDLGDLSALIPHFAAEGAQFVGLNPLHALFTADPERASPFAPSDRAFLNPFIIAADEITGFDPAMATGRTIPDASEMVDYAAVGSLKMAVLREVYGAWQAAADEAEREAHRAFVEAGGDALVSFATFEALSHHLAAEHGAGTKDWPEAYRTREAPGVAEFAREHGEQIVFHAWLQFIADRQLAACQEMARDAGMAIGLYLDLAVGTAPDGHATWTDPALSMRGVRVGAPPDLFSAEGQDWGLAPLSPRVLAERDFAPYRAMMAAVMRHAGAVRIDHAMGLERLWLVPDGEGAKAGAYVRQARLVDEVVAATHRHRAIAIGEDLGIVPPGFRERMGERRLFSMRIMMFERNDAGMRAPATYPVDALACLSTHDFAPLEGFWDGDDIAVRERLGSLSPGDAAHERRDRHHTKRLLLGLCGLPPGYGDAPLSETVLVALHRALARSTSSMMAVRLEDVVGGRRIVNLPGTDREHPNWRHTLPFTVEEIIASPRLAAVLAAVREGRP